MIAEQRGIMRALATTPMRDLLRGRLSGRLDLERAIGEADLPEPAAQLVRQVAGRTRLSRLERAEVAREIASHFREGLDAGRDTDDLIRAFGDPAVAARLIRRTKKRARSTLHKLWTRGWQAVGVAALILAAAYSIQTVRFRIGAPVVAHDYLADLNADAAAVPAAERAWPIYERAIAAFVEPPRKIPAETEPPMPGEFVSNAQTRIDVDEVDPGEEDWPEVVNHIRANQDTLALLRTAATRAHMGLTLSAPAGAAPEEGAADVFQGALLALSIPHLGQMRRLASLLWADARLAVVEDDGARAASDLVALIRMAAHAREPATLINQLFGLSILDLALDGVSHILADHPATLTDEQWSRVAHTLAGWCGGGRVRIEFGPERLYFYDALQRIYTDDGRGDGRLTLEGLRAMNSLLAATEHNSNLSGAERLAGPILAAAIAGRAEMRREYDRVADTAADYAGRAPWTRDDEAFQRETDLSWLGLRSSVRYMLVSQLAPAYWHVVNRGDEVGMRRDGTLVAIAMELYRQRHGVYPESLDALTPDLLPSVPRDIFDGSPVRCIIRDGSYTLYSIGADGDDDAGAPALDLVGGRDPRAARRGPNPVNGDWVLFPPEPR
ncbi:MAG: hypothetical protein D6693_11295 [Planctomycetota bacterium]|nr:MAG: hypothetical protein D6693_11295 [Planctomycetota bacterium]